MKWVVLVSLCLIIVIPVMINCATSVPQEVAKIRAHPKYKKLDDDEQKIAEKIIDKAIESEHSQYYFYKLSLLLDTDTASSDCTEKKNRKEINRSVNKSKKEITEESKRRKIGVEEYIAIEELYEVSYDRKWIGYRPYKGPYFYIVDGDPLDILVHIKVRLQGETNLISKIVFLEDSIEKHLKLPGYSVNLLFVGYSGDDVFDIDVDPSKWLVSHNWVSGYMALAHELLHLMGLDDEYDYIETHAGNRNMVIKMRLHWFFVQMSKKLPLDAKDGIMSKHWKKPLHRHACASVGLGRDCVEARLKKFGRK